MKRKPGIIVIFTLLGVFGYFLWAFSSVREGLDPENDFALWQPTADMIRKELPVGPVSERQKVFGLLFQKRFRKHDPGKAIGVHFMPNGKIQLLTPARLEPWNIDRIALMLYREVQQDLNKNCDIDIYETFIGTPALKIGELRPSLKSPQQVLVQFQYSRKQTNKRELSMPLGPPVPVGIPNGTVTPKPMPSL
jgi:hypothetical protein